MSDETDAKKILTASPMETWRRPPGRPRTMWIVDKDYPARLKSNNLSLNEASWRGSELSTLETDVYVWRYTRTLLVVVRLVYFSVIDVLYVSLQYFDTVGWVFWPVKTISHITYTVLAGMLHCSIHTCQKRMTDANTFSALGCIARTPLDGCVYLTS